MRKRWRYVLLFCLVAVLAAAIVEIARLAPPLPQGSYVQIDLGGSYREAPPSGLLGRLLRERPGAFLDLLDLIRRIRDDARIEGVVVRVTPLAIGWGKAQEIRAALLELAAAGKRVISLVEGESGAGTLEYYVASAAQAVYLAPASSVPLNGLAAQFLFLGGIWEKLDIEVNVEKIREYKTFGDMIANKEMTAAHREMANSLLDSMSAQIVADIASARGMSAAEVRAWMDKAPSTGRDLEAAKLSDGVKHLQDLETELTPETPFIQAKEYAASRRTRVPLSSRAKIAVVYAAGNIVTGESTHAPGQEIAGADTLSEALRDVQEDDDIKAIILRVDSPGGSALASDLIWRATQSVRKRKPIVVSMSDVAASGGYYISAGADRIVADPGTMTGSIGVVSMRPYLRKFLRGLGINSETITRGKFADMNDVTSPLDAERRQRLTREIEHVYEVFVDRVADGRKLSSERVNEIGRGRVWTGAQAKEIGLVDELGGFHVAEAAARALAGIAADEETELVFFPRSESFLGSLSELIDVESRLRLPRLLQAATEALLLPFEEHSVLTLMPQRIEVR